MDEGMLGCMREGIHLSRIFHISALDSSVHLKCNFADNLKYTRTDALGYNECLFGSTLEAALREKSMKGENIAC